MNILVTGASKGIGRAIAKEFLGYGKVFVTGRNEEALKTIGAIDYCLCDLSKDITPLIEFIKTHDIDILINNAGFGVFGSFDETSLKDELNLINVNIKALHILTKLFLKDLKAKNYGYILNVSSSAGFMTGPLLSSYYASKNYVLRLSLAIRELSYSSLKAVFFAPCGKSLFEVRQVRLHKHLPQ